MNQSVGQVAIVVRDYDEALDFYIGVLGFKLIEDVPVHAQGKRWVVVAPTGSSFIPSFARTCRWRRASVPNWESNRRSRILVPTYR